MCDVFTGNRCPQLHSNWGRYSQYSQWSVLELGTVPLVVKNRHLKIKWVSWTLEYLFFFFPL